jgi:hypothetical protein
MAIRDLLMQLKTLKRESPEDFYIFMNKLKTVNYELYDRIKVHFEEESFSEAEPLDISFSSKKRRRFNLWPFIILVLSFAFLVLVYSVFVVFLREPLSNIFEMKVFCYVPNQVVVYFINASLFSGFSNLEVRYQGNLIYSRNIAFSGSFVSAEVDNVLVRSRRYDIKLSLNGLVLESYCFAE